MLTGPGSIGFMEKEKTKSVLDGVPVLEGTVNRQPIFAKPAADLEIVGACPSCGAPIYGYKTISADIFTRQQEVTELALKENLSPGGTVSPPIKYSCTCWRKSGSIQNVMETK
jgi:hypothetical protein